MLRAFTHTILSVLMLLASSGWVVVEADCTPQGCCCVEITEQVEMDMRCCPQPETIVVEKTVDVLVQFDHQVDVNLYDEGKEIPYFTELEVMEDQIHSAFLEIPPPDNSDLLVEIQTFLI